MEGVGFYHKLHGHSDPTKDFIASKLLEGCRRDRRHGDARCPLTMPILSNILSALPHICESCNEQLLFTASMLCAFFGFMRIGKFTADSQNRVQDSLIIKVRYHFQFP